MPYVNQASSDSRSLGKSSFQYTSCRALKDGRVTIENFSDEAVREPETQALLRGVKMEIDPDISARFEAMHFEAPVELTDRAILDARCDLPRGAWRSAPISREEHLEKVRDCPARRLAEEATQRCIDHAEEVDRLTGSGASELLHIAGRVN